VMTFKRRRARRALRFARDRGDIDRASLGHPQSGPKSLLGSSRAVAGSWPDLEAAAGPPRPPRNEARRAGRTGLDLEVDRIVFRTPSRRTNSRSDGRPAARP
jgi:hypothetical protein